MLPVVKYHNILYNYLFLFRKMKFFKCVQCGVVTKSKKKMKVHHINNHVTPDCVPLLCMFCGFRSMDINRMRNHSTFFKSHGDKPVEIIFSKTPFKLSARNVLLLERLPLVKNFTFTPEEAFQPNYNDDLEEDVVDVSLKDVVEESMEDVVEEMETGDVKTGDVRRENWIDYGMDEFESMLQEDISANIYPYRPSIPSIVVNTDGFVFKNYRCK